MRDALRLRSRCLAWRCVLRLRVGEARGTACALRLTLAGSLLLVGLGCCVNTVTGALALWQPRMEPALAGSTAHPEWRLCGAKNAKEKGKGQKAKNKLSYSYSRTIQPGCEYTDYSHTSLCLSLTAYHSHVPGWWIGCPGVGPIRRCHRGKVPSTVLTSLRRQVSGRCRRAWARERIPGPPASPTKQAQLHGTNTDALSDPNPQAPDSGQTSSPHNRSKIQTPTKKPGFLSEARPQFNSDRT